MELSFFTNFANSITQQEAQINTLQEEISSGVSVQTPDQNPAAFEMATLSTDQIDSLNSDATTQANIQSQLGSVDTIYQSVSSLFNNVQAVLEQALNGTTSSQNMQELATQITSAGQQLLGLGNTTSTDGTFLFGGSRGNIPPFQISQSGSIIYSGDGAQSQAAISTDTSASTIANGEVFMSGLDGDGFASVAATGNTVTGTSNTGTGMLLSQGVSSPSAAAAFQASPTSSAITVTFGGTPSALTYTTTQNGVTSAATPVTSGSSVTLGGVDFELTGTPAAGDTFTITPSRPQSSFQLLQNIATTLSTAGTTAAQVAQTNQQLNQDLASLAQYQQGVATATAQNGVTLQAVSNAGLSNSNQVTALQTSVNNTIGVNVPDAITSLDETSTALEAAMKAFGSVQNLSLFNFISG
jgi:flagellar hook-associated protein 3 FlgL